MDSEARKLIADFEAGRVSRRGFLRRAGALGVGFTSVSALLAACGDPTATSAPATTSAATTAAAQTTAASAATTSAATTAAQTTAAQTTAAGAKLSGALELWSRETQGGGARQPLINARLADFDKANPGVTSKAQFMVFQESVQKTQAALAAGTPPEVGQQGPDVALGFAAAKNLLPLDDVLASIGKDKFVDLQKEAYVSYEGATYAIPWWSETRVLFYHKDLLEKAGVKPPTTWDELTEAAKKLTKGDQYGFIFNMETAGAGQFWIPLASSIGGNVLDKEGKVNVTSQPFKDALAFSASFVKDKTMPEAVVTYKSAEVIKLFQLKQVAMTVGNGEALENLRGVDPNLAANVGTVLIPVRKAGDPSRSFLGGFLLFAFAKAKNPEAAKALIKYMYGDPWYSDYMQKTNGAALPVLKSSIDTDFYQKDPTRKNLIEQLKTAIRYGGPVYGNTPYMGQAEGNLLFSNALVSVVSGKSSVDEALGTLDKELKKLAGQ